MEVVQNKTGSIALGANKYMTGEGIRGGHGMEQSTFRERMAKAGLRYRARLQGMDENKWTRKLYE